MEIESFLQNVESRIIKAYLPINRKVRPGIKRPETRFLVVHYTGGIGHNAWIVRNWFKTIAQSGDKYPSASSNYIIDLKGDILEVVPKEEVSWHGGGRRYTEFAKKYLKDNRGFVNPNLFTIGIEICHPDATGKFTKESIDSLKDLLVYLLIIYDDIGIIRHHDITGKLCPLYYVQYPEEWEQLLEEVYEYRDSL